MADTYTDLLLRLFPFDERSQAYPVEAELDDGSRFIGGELKLDREALLVQQLDPAAYGQTLFNALFPEKGEIRRAYDKATGRAEAESEGRLRLRLWVDNEAVELHAIPWERLYHWHKGRAVPLGASALTPLSRYTSLEIREPQPITDLPIRMLVAVSNPNNLPGDLAPANVDLEIENLRRALDELRKSGQVKVTLMPGHTGLSSALRAKLEGEGYTIVNGPTTLFTLAPQLMKAHIFHFIGHGAFKRKAERGDGTAALYLEKMDGAWQAVRDDDIVSMLAALGNVPHLFFLVACESAKREAGATSPFVGLGPKLVQAGVPAVVAMQEQVPVELARVLSGEFYARLAEHGEVDRALNQARLQVFNAKSTEWAIPVLFMRIRKGRLFGVDTDEDAPAPGVPPFKGLEYFNENDADKFYGRELLTAKLVSRLRTSRFLPIIIGASGSGKSSVIRAGVVPALRRGGPLADGSPPPEGSRAWPIHTITPAAHPLASLAAELTREVESANGEAAQTLVDDLRVDERSLHFFARKRLSQRQNANRFLLLVDQFEEVFTLCKDEDERRAFINNLLYASAESTDGPTIVIIIFRADFYAHCAQYANLRVAVSTNQEFVGPMNRAELRRAIEEPAKAGNWDYEPGLVDLILKEVGDEPGALPLMQHPRLETWKRRRGRTMTLSGYNVVGGIHGAIAKTAEAVYAELSAEQQEVARRIFLRLVELGEGTQDTRRRAHIAELYPREEYRPVVEQVLRKLVDNRLIVLGDQTAEVAHEALIREWPTLHKWINDSRDALRVHRELLDAAENWEKLNRDEGALYRGVQLGRALEWATANPDELGPLEREFVFASQAEAERAEREKEEQRQRELEAAKQIAEEQKRAANAEKKRAEEQARAAARQRVLSWVIGAVGVVAVILAIAAVGAFVQANAARGLADVARGVADAASTQAIQEQGIAQAASTQAIQQQGTAQAASTEAVAQEQLAIQQAATAEAAKAEAEKQQGIAIEQAATAEVAKALAEEQSQNALYQRLLSEAIKNQDTDPERTSLLILQALSQRVEISETEKYEAGNLLFAAGQAQRARLTLGLIGQSPAIYSAAYSPDGKLIATVGDAKSISLWSAETGAPMRVIAEGGHTELINRVAFSPNGKFVVTTSKDKTAKVWDVESGEATLTLDAHTDSVNSARFSRDGKQIVTVGNDGLALLWNVTTGKVIASLKDAGVKTPSRVWEVAVSPNGRYFATVHGDKIARVWDAITSAKVISLIGHKADVTAAAFSPDSLRLATASKDGELRLWSIGGLAQLIIPAHNDWIYSVAFSPDGRYVATASQDGTVKVWLAADGREVYRFTSHVREVYSAAFSPDGQALLSAGLDGSARVWDVSDAGSRRFLQFARLPHEIYAVAISPDGQWVVAAGQDKLAQLWNTETGEPGVTIRNHGDFIDAIAFSPDGKFLATGARDKVVRIFNLQTGQRIFIIPDGHLERVTAVTFSPDGKFLASASADKKVKVWNIATGKLTLTLAHPNAVSSVAYSPDGTKIATTNTDNAATVWDAVSGQALFEVRDNTNAILYAVFSPDGARLATAGEVATIHVWDADTGEEVLPPLIGQGGSLFGLQFSPDSRWLASAGSDRTLYLWDLETGQPRLTLFGPLGTIFGLAFHPDGQHIFTGGGDGVAHKFDVGIDTLIESARAFVTRPLTAAECQQYLLTAECPARP